MSSLNQKMIDLATAIRTKRGLANTELLSLDEMIEQIYLLEHEFWKQVATGVTTYPTMSINLPTVAPYALYGLQGINTITFTNTELTSIGDATLKNSSIQKVILPSSVTTLGESVFENTPLTSITASSVVTAGKACFKNCELKEFPKLSSNMTVLPEEFCEYTKSVFGPLTKINLPSMCTRIEPAALGNLTGINQGIPTNNSVNFSGLNVEYIGTKNFHIYGFKTITTNNPYLIPTVLNFPKLKTLKHYCFYFYGGISFNNYYQNGYYKFNFNSLETMGHRNFFAIPFKQITDTEFPVLKSMGKGCFSQNQLLKKVSLSNLETIKVSYKETQFNEGVYADDYDIAIGTEETSFRDCSNLEEVHFPNLKGHFDEDFAGCSSLKTLELGPISYMSTFECPSLENIILRGENPPSLSIRLIYDMDNNGQSREAYFPSSVNIYVNDPSLYATLDNWQYYYNRGCIKSISEYEG